MKKNTPFYIAAVFIFILLKFSLREMSTDSLTWLLKPVSFLVEIGSGIKPVYIAGSGYYFVQLDIVIDKSCSGYNFWLLCFLMLNGLALNFYHTVYKKMGVLVVSITAAYLLTLLVNSCRIITSINISAFNSILLFDEHLVHQSIGVITSLSFLIIIYLTTNFILIKKHEKYS